jgi:hypothetical protein
MGKLLSYPHVSISWETLTLDNDLKKNLICTRKFGLDHKGYT